MRARRSRGVAGLLLFALAASAGAGCNTFHYYDIAAEFDPAKFTPGSASGGLMGVGSVSVCQVVVTGADHTTFEIQSAGASKQACPLPNSLSVEPFEYSTFTDSGELTFTLNAYLTAVVTSDCLYATGSTTIQATAQTSNTGTISVESAGAGCM